MKETLESLGWVMYYECDTCNGQRQFFSHASKPKYEVRTKPNSQTFSILYENNIIAGPYWGYQLEEKLNKNVT